MKEEPSLESIVSAIVEANTAYRNGDAIMSDEGFDALCEKASAMMLEEDWNVFRESLHESAGKVQHPYTMGSLRKVKASDPAGLDEFLAKVAKTDRFLNVSRKVDGISCRLHYQNGVLVSASTRGDGTHGEDITSKVFHVMGVPNRIDADGAIDIRGELVIRSADFDTLNSLRRGRGDKEFSARRNAVAGLFNSRGGGTDEEVSLVSFVAYTVMGPELSKADQLMFLRKNGFWPTEYEDIDISNLHGQDAVDSLVTILDKMDRTCDYEGDGLVICGESHHEEDRYIPELVVAFKVNRQVAETTICSVDWGVPSKDGTLCPVAVLDPVDLNGATIGRVTLHNLDNIEAKGLKLGSRVQIVRSGDVIPYLSQCLDTPEESKALMPIPVPEVCPSCGKELMRVGVNMSCVNPSCPEKEVQEVVQFLTKLDIKGFKANILKNLGCGTFAGLLSFSPKAGMKTDEALRKAVDTVVMGASKKSLLMALNFRGLSDILLEAILGHYGLDTAISMTAVPEDLPPNVGTTRMVEFITSLPRNLSILKMFMDDPRYHGNASDIAPTASQGIQAKGSICVTGSLSYGSRTKFLAMVKEHGWEAKPSVCKGLTYLITNDPSSGSSKNRKAQALGVKVITEAEFMGML